MPASQLQSRTRPGVNDQSRYIARRSNYQSNPSEEVKDMKAGYLLPDHYDDSCNIEVRNSVMYAWAKNNIPPSPIRNEATRKSARSLSRSDFSLCVAPSFTRRRPTPVYLSNLSWRQPLCLQSHMYLAPLNFVATRFWDWEKLPQLTGDHFTVRSNNIRFLLQVTRGGSELPSAG